MSVAVYCSPVWTVSALRLMVGVCVDVGNWYGTATDNAYPKATPSTNAIKLMAMTRADAVLSPQFPFCSVLIIWFVVMVRILN